MLLYSLRIIFFNRNIMRYFMSFLFLSLSLYGFNYHLKPYRISEGIYCFFGLPSQVSHINGGNMVNSCYIDTGEAYVVIDSGPTYAYAQEAYEVMKKRKKLPVAYVINTSWDEVHVLGNEFYRELGAKLIGPKDYKKYIENKETLFLERKLSKDAFLNTRVVPLDYYLEEDKVLNFKDISIEIKSIENDKNHLYVYIEEKDIVFAGDLIFNNRIVPLQNSRSLLRWLEALEELTALKWSDIISSHGYMTRRSALKNTKSYLFLLKSEVLQSIKEGKSRQETIEEVKLLSFVEDRFYEVWHHKNVGNAYDELKSYWESEQQVSKESTLVSEVQKELNKIASQEQVILKKPIEKVKKISKESQVKKKISKDHSVKYRNFSDAINRAKRKNKIVLVKVRSTICKYCDQLERVIAKNSKVKQILNRYFEVVKINIDSDLVPLDIVVRSTPTLIFIEPSTKKVLMKLAGIRALGELLEVLNEAVDDGYRGGYLKP